MKLLSEGIQANLSKIQKNLEIIQEQKENVNELQRISPTKHVFFRNKQALPWNKFKTSGQKSQ